ncbi:MAG: hypothetical protein RL020_186 [Pseudomonadota bacterium]|jgi:hypothetical protein
MLKLSCEEYFILQNSKLIAGLAGPMLMALSLSEAINYHIWAINIASVTYLNGSLLLLAGISIIRAHNHWMRGWPVIVTLVGWFVSFMGLWRMFFPEARQGSDISNMYFVFAVLFVMGVFLTYKAYRRDQP